MKHRTHGFTIVELLVVIVVIAILAAITIVSYNGIVGRATTVQGQVTARQVVEKIELWNMLQGSYPTFGQLITNSLAPTYSGGVYTAGGGAGPEAAKLPDTIKIVHNDYPRNEGEVAVIICSNSPGGALVYRDKTTSVLNVKDILWGGATTITYGSTPNC